MLSNNPPPLQPIKKSTHLKKVSKKVETEKQKANEKLWVKKLTSRKELF